MGSATIKRWALLVCLLLAACEPQRQPVAGGIIPPTPTATPSFVEPLRYGLGVSLQSFHLATDDLRQLALVDDLTTDYAEGYDLLVSSLPQEGWETADNTLTLGLVINAATTPLNDSNLRDMIVGGLDARALVDDTVWQPSQTATRRASQIRAALTAQGRPDGLPLVLAYETEAALMPLISLFNDMNIELVTIPTLPQQRSDLLESGQAQLFWVVWGSEAGRTAWEQQAGAANVIAMVQVPLYYLAADGISLTGSSNSGLPLIARD